MWGRETWYYDYYVLFSHIIIVLLQLLPSQHCRLLVTLSLTAINILESALSGPRAPTSSLLIRVVGVASFGPGKVRRQGSYHGTTATSSGEWKEEEERLPSSNNNGLSLSPSWLYHCLFPDQEEILWQRQRHRYKQYKQSDCSIGHFFHHYYYYHTGNQIIIKIVLERQ